MSNNSDDLEIAAGWALLRAGGHDTGALTVPSFPSSISTPLGSIRLALGNNGEARLLLPIHSSDEITGLGNTPALVISSVAFTIDGRSVRFLDLICLVKELESAFGEVVDEILRRVSAGSSPLESVGSALEDFRALLLSGKGSRITQSQIAGLIGELLFLNRLLDRSPGAWEAWRGPMGDRHDFRRINNALEIKTSLRAGKSVVTINSLDQLQEPKGGELHLLHFNIEVAGGGILTIQALGQNAISKADKPDKVRELIAAAGCDDHASPLWNELAFRQESETLYRVSRGFPRLTASELIGGFAPPGVQEVNYRADLAIATNFICDTSQYAELERILAG